MMGIGEDVTVLSRGKQDEKDTRGGRLDLGTLKAENQLK